MAHECHDREDLLRDARALTPRIQLQAAINGRVVSLFAGFRGAALSVYFGADPVFHFNAARELRRAFVAGRLVKADGGQLTAMERVHTAASVELRGEQLSDADSRALLDDVADRLSQLRCTMATGDYTLDGQVPADGDARERLTAWLAQPIEPAVAASPRVG
jgi:hypothetical protein